MTFLHTWFLAGLAACLVPLLLHVIQTRRIRKVPFSTLFLLKMIHRQRSLRIKVSRLLLLLARIGLAALVTLVFAQPYFTAPTLAFLNPGPRLVGVVWDNSGATRATDGRQTVSDLLKARLVEFVGSLSERDSLVVVATSPTARLVYRGAPSKFPVANLPPATYAGGDRERALDLVAESFKLMVSSESLLAVFSDFRRAVWKESAARIVRGARTLLFPARPATFVNWGITRAEVAPTVSALGEPVTAKITLRFVTSGPMASTQLTVLLDGRKVDSRTMSASNEPIVSQIPITNLREGIHRILFRLNPDSLDIDDEREVSVRVLPHRQVLLVNGKKRATPSQDEGFFLRKVLGTPASPRRGLLTREVYELPATEDLHGFQSVVVTGVRTIPAGMLKKLSQYVETGGSLLVFLGDQVDAASYNAGLMKWTGLELSRRVEASGPPKPLENVEGVLESVVDQPFWQSVTIDRYYLCLRKAKVDGVRTLLALDDGTPFLVVAARAAGTAMLVNASSTLESGDLPLHPIFPVMVGEAVRSATGAAIEQYATGQRIVLPLLPHELEGVLSIEGPGGRITTLKPARVGSTLAVAFDDTNRPGLYTFVRRTRDEARQVSFVVAPPPVESDLTPLSAPELGQLWPGATLPAASGGTRSAAPSNVTSPFNLVDLLLYLALFVVVLELLLVWDMERKIFAGSGTEAGA